MSIRGVRFADAWSSRASSDFDGVTGNVISRQDLIATKRAAGRPQDLIDINNLVESEQLSAEVPAQPEPTTKRSKKRRRDPGSTR